VVLVDEVANVMPIFTRQFFPMTRWSWCDL